MENIIETLGNAKMAHTNMNININSQEVVKSIFALIEEDIESIEKANKIDVNNKNGFKLEGKKLEKIKNKIIDLEDAYRKVIYMKKNDNNYLEGKQTDNLGTICIVYDGNTYCLLELVLKAILTHNAIILVSETDYMKATNELIVILIQRILESYKVDKNLVQILYTSKLEELLSNSISINKVIAIGNKNFQDKIKKISKIEVIGKGYNNFDIYIEDDTNISFVKEIVEQSKNIDIYVKEGIQVPFEDYILVQDIEEAIGLINCNTSGFSSSIYTDNNQNASQFLREIKTETISVNSSPLIENTVDLDTQVFLTVKNMLYPNPLSDGTEKSKFEFPTARAILEENKIKGNDELIKELQKQNLELKTNNEKIQKENLSQIQQKECEVNSLKRQLEESQNLANKYMNIFRKSFFTRLFGGLDKKELDRDTKLLS